MSRRIRLVALGAAVAALVGVSSASAATVVVRQDSLQGWAQANQATASQAFVSGPGSPPAGTGSLQMTTGSGSGGQGGKAWMYQASYDGTRLADLTTLQYSTYQAPSSASPDFLVPSLQFGVDADNNGTFDGTLVFEPVYTAGNGGVVKGQWQSWDALQGRWWSTRALPPGPGLPNGMCAFDCYLPWSQVVAAYPDAKLVSNGLKGIQVVAGQNSVGPTWQGFDGNVDAVQIGVAGNATSFDFEPGTTPPPAPTCKLIRIGVTLLGRPIVICI